MEVPALPGTEEIISNPIRALIVASDFNLDGNMDIAIVGRPIDVMLGDGAGNFKHEYIAPQDLQYLFGGFGYYAELELTGMMLVDEGCHKRLLIIKSAVWAPSDSC
jgi:hypothetical protein